MAVEAHTTRRAMFAIASAATLLPAAAMAAPAPIGNNDAMVLHWEREAARYEALACDALFSDQDTDAFCAAAAEYEALIAGAPCDSHTVALVKMRTVVRAAAVDGCTFRGISAADMIDSIVAYMTGLN